MLTPQQLDVVDLPLPVAATIASMSNADGTGAACNFCPGGKAVIILDRPLQRILAASRVTKAVGQLPIAGWASTFTAHITPQRFNVIDAGWCGEWFHTKLDCLGRQRGVPVNVHATCTIHWKLTADSSAVRRAAIGFKTRRLSIALPSFRLH